MVGAKDSFPSRLQARGTALEIFRRRNVSGITRVQGYYLQQGQVRFKGPRTNLRPGTDGVYPY